MNKALTRDKFSHIAGFLTLAIFFLSDRWFKRLSLGGLDLVLIPEFLNFKFFANKNIAFSLPLEGAWLIFIITLIISFLIFYFLRFYWALNKTTLFGLGAVITGALSNLIDRFTNGFVIDYLDLSHFTIFNVADILIVVGTALIFWGLIKENRQNAD
ncbi:MAG: signal peptidase II [Candidatus Parcubacteria bacterium]|jgi:signal peptidase II|nr:MAG: signal peptidase II [Candidatus Parcubacteria bacterium]